MKKLILILFTVVCFFMGSFVMSNNLKHTKELKIAFLGDSITYLGWDLPYGYVNETVKILNREGFKITPFPAGVCGNITKDMLKRMDNDVLSHNPDIMFFMGGINDIWLKNEKVEKYRKNVEKIVDKAQKNKVEVIIINLSILTEDADDIKNKEISKYNKMLEKISQEKNVQLIDINTALWEEIKKHKKQGCIVTVDDGVHLNKKGNKILADKVTEEFLKTHKD